MPTENLKADILKRHASVHAFCKAHPELSRSSVYLALSGKYPGNVSEQAARIQAALSEAAESPKRYSPDITSEAVEKMLQEIRCSHCRRLDRRECLVCREQTEREGKELFCRLFKGGEHVQNTDTGNSDADKRRLASLRRGA